VELVIDKNMLMLCYSSFYSENVKNVEFHRQSDEWLASAHKRQSMTEKKHLQLPASTIESLLIMVKRGDALCPSLKNYFKKLAAEPNPEPIHSLPPSPTEHAS
jgi:hypothetical protein